MIVDKSTVSVVTAERLGEAVTVALAGRGQSLVLDVCSSPEFLKEGAAIDDFTHGARIVVGTDSEQVKELMRECYGPYIRLQEKLIFMNVRSAKLTEHATNAVLATKISFMNEIANLAERLGADAEQVRRGIGYQFIYPGCGYGGYCFPKDVQALAGSATEVDYQAELLNTVESSIHAISIRCLSSFPRSSMAISPAWPSPSGGWPSSPKPTTCLMLPTAR